MCGSLAISGTVVEEKEEEACLFFLSVVTDKEIETEDISFLMTPLLLILIFFLPLLDLAMQQHHSSLDSPSDCLFWTLLFPP